MVVFIEWVPEQQDALIKIEYQLRPRRGGLRPDIRDTILQDTFHVCGSLHSLQGKELDAAVEHVQVASRKVLFLSDFGNNLQRKE